MNEHLLSLAIGFLLDYCFGDPRFLPHPVCGMGNVITVLEKYLRKWFKKTPKGQLLAGFLLVLLMLSFTGTVVLAVLWVTQKISPALGFTCRCILCYQMLAARGLKQESMKVYDALKEGNLPKARMAVSMIVGRDTKQLDEDGVVKAAVETVAENTSDGVIAPAFYMMLLGAFGGVIYKAVNTMDSMVGYKNEKYLYFGRAAAKLDDILNFIPSRLSAWLMILASVLLGFNGRGAVKIYKRDRRNHKSPNSAQTESVCAGALNIRLAGDAFYFGTLYKKPFIGDDCRRVEYEDIKKSNQLMYGAAVLFLSMAILVYGMVTAGKPNGFGI